MTRWTVTHAKLYVNKRVLHCLSRLLSTFWSFWISRYLWTDIPSCDCQITSHDFVKPVSTSSKWVIKQLHVFQVFLCIRSNQHPFGAVHDPNQLLPSAFGLRQQFIGLYKAPRDNSFDFCTERYTKIAILFTVQFDKFWCKCGELLLWYIQI